jgi:hypothetical protein
VDYLPKYQALFGRMSREAERWNIDLGVEIRGLRKVTRGGGQSKEDSRMRLPEEVSKKREVTSSPVAEGSPYIYGEGAMFNTGQFQKEGLGFTLNP